MHRYASHYCEENVWWLAQEPRFGGLAAEVVLVSNDARTVLVHAQRAGDDGAPVINGSPAPVPTVRALPALPAGAVVWDYHVVLAVRSRAGVEVWDLDCTLGAPLTAVRWLDASFDPGAPPALAPRFRVVAAERFVATFASDRRHMRTEQGDWIAPPPPWPPIGDGAHDLERWIDLREPAAGPVLDLVALRARWA